MADSVLDQVRQMLADLLSRPIEAVGAEAAPSNLEGWDSLVHLNLVLAIEQRFGVFLEPEDDEPTVGQIASRVGAERRG